tara:strand:+ start:405 stop:965 length:561 start_codon:yes stop_codon:yes gene_type:complete
MMEIQVVSVLLLLLVVVMVADIHFHNLHIEQEDLVDLVAVLQGTLTTVLLTEVLVLRQVDLDHLDKETPVEREELTGGIVQVLRSTWVVEAAVLAVLVEMHLIQIIMLHHIHHHHILDQLGVDGTVLPEPAVLENQTPLFHQQILQVIFPNPHFHYKNWYKKLELLDSMVVVVEVGQAWIHKVRPL